MCAPYQRLAVRESAEEGIHPFLFTSTYKASSIRAKPCLLLSSYSQQIATGLNGLQVGVDLPYLLYFLQPTVVAVTLAPTVALIYISTAAQPIVPCDANEKEIGKLITSFQFQ